MVKKTLLLLLLLLLFNHLQGAAKEVEMESSSFVIEADLDDQTLEELRTLKEIRMGLLQKQLADVDATVDELIRRELIPAGDKSEYVEEARQELLGKIARMNERTEESSGHIHFDELEMYIDLLNSP